ncbi:hypothetical protein PCANC_15380 [Puccinia coronata f. sp. avenae]|nr:hypothetical protein PCANC_15380 [Puccinia coronata f. sp. avenae]
MESDLELKLEGRQQAADAGETLQEKRFRFDQAIISGTDFIQSPAQISLDIVLTALGQEDITITKTSKLRARSYYDNRIKPLVQEGKNVLVVAHTNPIASIMSHIEGQSVEKFEGKWENVALIVYDFNSAGQFKRAIYDPKGDVITTV